MKRDGFLCLTACLVLALCAVVPLSAKEKKEKKKAEVFFSVSMDCKSCVTKIEKNLAFEKGVTDLEVDLEKQTVRIEYRSDKTDPEKLAAALKKLGFEAEKTEPDKKTSGVDPEAKAAHTHAH